MTDFDQEPLPPRPRRRMMTPLGWVAAAVLIAALGFVGGVKVEKSRADSSGSGNNPAAAFARFGAAGGTGTRGGTSGGGGGQGTGATVGSVSSVDGSSFYVADQSGNKVHVKTDKNSKVTRSAVAHADDIHPGDTVIVQGHTASSGTIVASTVIATASNASSGLGAFFRGGSAGGGAGGAGGFGGGAPQASPTQGDG
jgi:uncharacterized protein DUF5666